MVYSFTYLLQHFASLQELGCSNVNHTQGSSVIPDFYTVWIIVLCDVTQRNFTLYNLKFV